MISVVIPNYNGRKLLETYLPQNFPVFKQLGMDQIIVVDDASQDDSVAYLCDHFPEVEVVVRDENGGFSKAANTGVAHATHDIVFLLNTDIVVQNLELDPILAYFKKDDVFSVTPRVIRPWQNDLDEGLTTGYMKNGWFFMEICEDPPDRDLDGQPVLWGCGGATFIDRKKFGAMSGFDENFSPFYVEDVDLCYRAWKMGWASVYVPHSSVLHWHSQTIKSKHSTRNVHRVALRNRYYFIWKNITDVAFRRAHLWWMVRKVLRLEFVEIRAMLAARRLMKCPRPLTVDVLSDREILGRCLS